MIAEHTLNCDNHNYIEMEDSQVKLDFKCSRSIGENHVQVQKKKEDTLRSGIHSYIRTWMCVCMFVCMCLLVVTARLETLNRF